jgi:hypothetical protein
MNNPPDINATIIWKPLDRIPFPYRTIQVFLWYPEPHRHYVTGWFHAMEDEPGYFTADVDGNSMFLCKFTHWDYVPYNKVIFGDDEETIF